MFWDWIAVDIVNVINDSGFSTLNWLKFYMCFTTVRKIMQNTVYIVCMKTCTEQYISIS